MSELKKLQQLIKEDPFEGLDPQNAKLEKLKRILSLVDESVSRKEFLDNFRIIIDLVRSLQTQHKDMMESLDTKYANVISELINSTELKNNKEIGSIKSEVASFCKTAMDEMHATMQEKMSEMKDGEDGEDADEEEVAQLAAEKVQALIPTVEQVSDEVEKELPKLGQRIRDGLELLKGDERLSIDAIKDLREELDKLERKLLGGNKVYVPAAGGNGGHTMYVYDLSSSLDGVTKTFNLPAFWRVISVQSSSFPNAFRPTVDYTTDGSVYSITFTSEIEASTTLASGQTIIITYST